MARGERHVILTGPQRTGKSHMLQIMSRLGMDTGFLPEEWEDPNRHNEFFEHRLWGENYERSLPYVVKHAKLASSLGNRVDRFGWEIDYVFIFLRQVDECVDSSVNLDRGGTHKHHRARFYNRVGKILYTVEERGWPYKIIWYPRFVHDVKYLQRCVRNSPVAFYSNREIEKAWRASRSSR